MLTRSDLEVLGRFQSQHHLATTLYLPLDVEQPPRYPIVLRDLARRCEAELERTRQPHKLLASAREDLARLERYVSIDLDRTSALGLAAFCCSGERYWQAFRLPVSLPARLIQEPAFYVRPLAAILDEYRRIMLALINRRRARLFQIQMGEVREQREIVSEVPSKVREGGYAGYAERSIRGHIEDHVRRHFEQAAAAIFEVFQEQGFEWLVLGGAEPTLSEFGALLHPYLRERLRATLTINVDASPPEVIEAGRGLERRLKAERDAELMNRLKEGLFPGGWAVSGPSETLQLLAQGLVRTLIVRPGFSRPGVWCPRCRLLLPEVKGCPLGCGDAVPVKDVIEEAMALALEAGGDVAHVEHEAMEGLGNVAAILRYARRELTSK
jgi:peptide chain release factor subunit 1